MMIYCMQFSAGKDLCCFLRCIVFFFEKKKNHFLVRCSCKCHHLFYKNENPSHYVKVMHASTTEGSSFFQLHN